MPAASISPESAPVVVFGASGYVGSNLVPLLVAQGTRVRAVARQRRPLEARGWRGVELVEADALDPTTLPAAFSGASVVFYLVHSMAAGRDFGRLDRVAAANVAAAAAAAGVERIVYLGGLTPSGADSEHLVSRKESGDVLRSGAVPVTEVRAGIIVGAGSAAYEVMRDLVYSLPVMVTPKWVRSKSSPIALDNLLHYLVQVATLPQARGQLYDAGGPEYLSYQQMMIVFGQVVGRRPLIIPVPVLSPRLSSYWLGLVTAVPTSIARALVAGLKHDIPAHDAPLRALVPQRLLTFREAVDAALDAERNQQVTARWTEGAFPYRAYRHDYAYYAKRASGSAIAAAPPASVWRVLTAIGGANGYFALNACWRLREWLDWLLGGPGLSRGRRHPSELRIGDAVDSWTVIGLEPDRRLTLGFGMRAPGAGILEFELEPLADGSTRLTETAYWHPQGVWGLIYWYALAPMHRFIFKRMTRAIVDRATVDATGAAGPTSRPTAPVRASESRASACGGVPRRRIPRVTGRARCATTRCLLACRPR
jgi:uncharacterized protein YbjT (DUF2867 family)/uncharacterized protein YndB with AHSA1/START domain